MEWAKKHAKEIAVATGVTAIAGALTYLLIHKKSSS